MQKKLKCFFFLKRLHLQKKMSDVVSFENGCMVQELIDDESYENRLDKRLGGDKAMHRMNINNRENKRKTFKGCHYEGRRMCNKCNKIKDFKKFANYAIDSRYRHHYGLNVHCRSCQKRQYTAVGGYLVDDIIVDDAVADLKVYKKTDYEKKQEEKEVEEEEEEEEEEEDEEEEVEEEEEDKMYDVEAIVSHKKVGKKMYFEVKWLNYPSSANTFEPFKELKHLHVLQKYVRRHF